jgi:hypothetical protein
VLKGWGPPKFILAGGLGTIGRLSRMAVAKTCENGRAEVSWQGRVASSTTVAPNHCLPRDRDVDLTLEEHLAIVPVKAFPSVATESSRDHTCITNSPKCLRRSLGCTNDALAQSTVRRPRACAARRADLCDDARHSRPLRIGRRLAPCPPIGIARQPSSKQDRPARNNARRQSLASRCSRLRRHAPGRL